MFDKQFSINSKIKCSRFKFKTWLPICYYIAVVQIGISLRRKIKFKRIQICYFFCFDHPQEDNFWNQNWSQNMHI